MSDQPIAEHALLSDCHTAALVDRAGSVEWWCSPRFDSPSVFGRILDDGAGHFSIVPRRVGEVTRRYQEDSLVLTTTFRTPSGVVELTDALAMGDGVRGHDLGIDSPHVLLRQAECVEGDVELEIEFVPRPEYGLTFPSIRQADGGVVARGGSTTLYLSSSIPLEIDGSVANGSVTLTAGERAAWAVASASSWDPPLPAWSHDQIGERIADTLAAWQSWKAAHQNYEGPYAELVEHSGRVLQALTYRPTGAMVAAPTTSLPETVGGERNWDYRYSWVRDASDTLGALWIAACPDEAADFVTYLTTAASSFHQRQELQVMFGVRGERNLTEQELFWLDGWRESKPVRVGNGAWAQRQLDVYGQLLAAVRRLEGQLPDLGREERELLAGLADVAARVWNEPDHGIWEIRDEPRHYLHSKLLCWVALDSAIDLAGWLGAADRVDDWQAAREEIRDAILADGWSEEVGAFTQSFGAATLDASVLLIPIVGFLPFDDPRVVATIDAVTEELTDSRGLVRRYRSYDGLPGEEGAFLLCTFWLAEALARLGRVDQARQVFERAIDHCNDVGLLSEEVDSESGELVGNFPQAFSHVGLINAAWAIAQAES